MSPVNSHETMSRVNAVLFGMLMMCAALSGCLGGDDSSGGEEINEILDDWNVYYAESGGDLPECNDATLGRLYYVNSDSEFRVCMPEGWEKIDISGPPGAAGAAGAAGAVGPAGADAVLEEGCFNSITGEKYDIMTLMSYAENFDWSREDVKSICEGLDWVHWDNNGVISAYCWNGASQTSYMMTKDECESWQGMHHMPSGWSGTRGTRLWNVDVSVASDEWVFGKVSDSPSSRLWIQTGERVISEDERDSGLGFSIDYASNTANGFRWIMKVDGNWYYSDDFGTEAGVDHGSLAISDYGTFNQPAFPTVDISWEEESIDVGSENWYHWNIASSIVESNWRGWHYEDMPEWINSSEVNPVELPDGEITNFGLYMRNNNNGNSWMADNFEVSVGGSAVYVEDFVGTVNGGYVNQDSALSIHPVYCYNTASNMWWLDSDFDDPELDFCGNFEWYPEVDTGDWFCIDTDQLSDINDGDWDEMTGAYSFDMETCLSFYWQISTSGLASSGGIGGIIPVIVAQNSENCVNGGTMFRIGSDFDKDGMLSQIETMTSLDICNGKDGRDGADGADGPPGKDGVDGQDGADGAQGPQGPAGNDGVDGQDGADGAQGPQGPAGNDGVDGTDGADGAQGPQGPAGNDGADGTDGADGAQGPQGPAGNDGADGTDGADGAQGPAGNDGADGVNGTDGQDGVDGTDGVDGLSALVLTSTEPSGSNCADGGIKIEVGVDDNDDGNLQSSEIDQTTYICNGADGVDGVNGSASASTMLTSISTPALTACDTGRIISNGLDNGDGGGTSANGVLESGEVDFMTTFCSKYLLHIQDINSGGSTSNPSYLTAVGNTLYFQASDGTNGAELWKSDGTSSGTVMVKDIVSGSGHSIPSYLVAVGDTLFFSADDATNGRELWKSDGTAAGTSLVKDINSGSSHPGQLTAVGNTLYFIATDGTNGAELWKSNGTSSGTVMVKDIYNGSSTSSLSSLTAVGNTLYFVANDGTNGPELWKTDGTSSGTVIVKDIDPGASGSSPSFLTAVGSTLYFEADDGTNGAELWKSDGTSSGTVMVKDIIPGASGSGPSRLSAIGSTLYFQADDGTNGAELWKSDGTSNGTVMVKDINPGSGTSWAGDHGIIAVGNTIYFRADDGTNGAELWKSDGTSAGTMMVKDINSGGSASSPWMYAIVGSTFYFQANDGTNGFELWMSDGTSAGTKMVKDISSGSGSSYPGELTVAGDVLYLKADDGNNGKELWVLELDGVNGTPLTHTVVTYS